MTKRQYLSSLKKELKIFNEEKIDKYYKEYRDKFNELSKTGLSDEEVIKKLGNVDDIINELLDKEKKNSKKKTNKDNKFDKNKYVRIIVDEAKDFVNKIGKLLNVKSDDDLLKLVVDTLLVFVCIMLLKVPFAIFKEIGFSVFSIFPNFIAGLFSLIWGLLVQIVYFATSIYLIYTIVKRVVIGDKSTSKGMKEIKKDIKEEVNKVDKNNITNMMLKVLVFIITLPLYFISFLLFIGLGIVVGLILNGVMVTGILLIIIALLIVFVSIIKLVNSMVFGGK